MKEDANEEEMSLEDLQEYIEAENRRLDAENGFWAKEIVRTHRQPTRRPRTAPADAPRRHQRARGEA